MEETERELLEDVLNLEWVHKKLEDEKQIWEMGRQMGEDSRPKTGDEGQEQLREEWMRVQAELDGLLEDEKQGDAEVREVEKELRQFEEEQKRKQKMLGQLDLQMEKEEGQIKENLSKLEQLNTEGMGEMDEELKYYEDQERKLNGEIREWEAKILELTKVLESETRATKRSVQEIQIDVRGKIGDLEETLEK